jgi:RNA polymerase-binding protein DksA
MAGERGGVDLAHYKKLLEKKQAQVNKGFEEIKNHTFSESLKESTGEDSSYDQHSADLAFATFEREKDLGLKDGLEIDRAKIGLALDRIATGKYGYCLRCGSQIPSGRLEAVPEAELCLDCQKYEEVRPASRRPVEEETPRLGPPGGFELLTDDVYSTGEDRPNAGRGQRPKRESQ